MRQAWLLWIILPTVAAVSAFDGWEPVRYPDAELPEKEIRDALMSSETIKRREGYRALLRRRAGIVEFACRLAREQDDGKTYFGRKECGIVLLGEMRDEVAVPLLLDNIAFAPLILEAPPSEYDKFPAVQALIKIGNSAAKEILDKRLASARNDELPLHLMVLKHVWGSEVSLVLVKEKLKGDLSKDARANFQAALEYFEARRQEAE